MSFDFHFRSIIVNLSSIYHAISRCFFSIRSKSLLRSQMPKAFISFAFGNEYELSGFGFSDCHLLRLTSRLGRNASHLCNLLPVHLANGKIRFQFN